uniref:Uncharacterized protein n=1 Tax=Arundo donax TaxID=35708 RepID=A0A0A9DB03_ARUDO
MNKSLYISPLIHITHPQIPCRYQNSWWINFLENCTTVADFF